MFLFKGVAEGERAPEVDLMVPGSRGNFPLKLLHAWLLQISLRAGGGVELTLLALSRPRPQPHIFLGQPRSGRSPDSGSCGPAARKLGITQPLGGPGCLAPRPCLGGNLGPAP